MNTRNTENITAASKKTVYMYEEDITGSKFYNTCSGDEYQKQERYKSSLSAAYTQDLILIYISKHPQKHPTGVFDNTTGQVYHINLINIITSGPDVLIVHPF